MFVADSINKRMQVFDAHSGDSLGYSTGDGVGRFITPAGIDVRENGQIGVVDSALNQIKLWNDAGFRRLNGAILPCWLRAI